MLTAVSITDDEGERAFIPSEGVPLGVSQSVGDLPSDVRAALVSRLERAPVSLGLIFGSYAAGQATSGSDIDIAVEYDAGVNDVTDVHLSLVTDLTCILDRDDVDVVRLGTVDPRIAAEALDQGHLLVGTVEDVEKLRERFDGPRRRREEAVRNRIEEAERKIERRLQRRKNG